MRWSLLREWVATAETLVLAVALVAYLALYPDFGRVPFVHGVAWFPISLARGTVLGLGCETFFPCAMLVFVVALVYGLTLTVGLGVAIRATRLLVARAT